MTGAAAGSEQKQPQLGFTEIELRGVKRKIWLRPKTSDEHVLKDVFVTDMYGPNFLRRADELLDYFNRRVADGQSPLVVDAGTNIGATALYFNALFGAPRIVAVESSAENFKLLELNTDGRDIRCVNAAVSSQNGLAQVIDAAEGQYWAYGTAPVGDDAVATPGKRLEVVPRITMNEIYAAEAGGSFPLLAKIDIEGGEADLFSANTEWVDKTPLIIIELHDWMLPRSGTSHAFLRCIAALDRDFVVKGDNVFSIANRLP